jgi:hypothetical protein
MVLSRENPIAKYLLSNVLIFPAITKSILAPLSFHKKAKTQLSPWQFFGDKKHEDDPLHWSNIFRK